MSDKLRIALKERSNLGRRGAGVLSASHRFSEARALWRKQLTTLLKQGRRSPRTLDTYRSTINNFVSPAFDEVRLGEMTTPLVDAFIAKVRDEVGVSTAKLCRSVMSGIMGVAVRKGAVGANPVREVESIEAVTTKVPRAMTGAERRAFLAHLRADEYAVRHDLPDLVTFMLATGVRIGESLAVLWSEVNLDAGTVEISSTIVRVTGEGLLRKTTKSSAGQRILALPSWAVSMLRDRFMTGVRLDHPVFPDVFGNFRDPNNTLKALRLARGDDESMSWITSHTFRKTTATILDDAGHSARRVADQLGHARPSMTQDVYMGRKVQNPEAAAALETALDDDE